MIDRLVLVGLSHQTAPVAVRERLARLGQDLGATLSSLVRLPAVSEGMVLSTCNRVELYGAGEPAARVASSLRDFVRGQGLDGETRDYLYERQGEDAARHLFRVAASLDSMVVGEPQILGQLKDAFQAAATAGATGDCLHRTVGRAFAVAKRVRTETEVGRNAVSMSHAAVELARKIFASLEGKRVLLIGAGEMAGLAARHLVAQGVAELFVANRSEERARQLAAELGTGTVRSLEALPELLAEADIVLSAAGGDGVGPLLTRPLIARAVKARRFRPLFLVDLAVPRSIEPAAGGLANVYLKDVDDIGAAVRQNTERRLGEAQRAEAIIDGEVHELARVLRGRSAVPVLAELRRLGDAVAEAEAQRTLAQIGAALDGRGRESIAAMARAIVNKLLHQPTTRLRRAAELGVEAELADATARLFALGDGSEREPAEEEGPPEGGPGEEDPSSQPGGGQGGGAA
ncbi:MAG: glutamyl-tRNA reductase [Myxococcales bacterium]